ncbi:conserved Plasmodium protein, unknown function [Plasmodium malariae]|uniref:Uncharacterized protein n=1 Tax=Plasmodium malariae TaxID=5858 RepID=A0A1D3JKN5_PLAMA|nr:conserved Plasmodium protein, unknown function [Plasmodium malariae]SBT87080.1 conserved Plasmodium protein, unknown function [Plasmodium malariae]
MHEQVRLVDVHELKVLFMEGYNEYIKLVKHLELYYQKLQLNWYKFHLFYELNKNDTSSYSLTKKKKKGEKRKKCTTSDKKKKKKKKKSYSNYKTIEEDLKIIQQKEKKNNCYYFKTYNNSWNNSFILHCLKEVPNSVELYINIKIETMNKLKNSVLTELNNFCKLQINKFIFLIFLCELKLNNLQISQKDINHKNKDVNRNIVKHMILFCKNIIQEITKNIIPFFFVFNIFSTSNYFNYHFKHFCSFIEMLEMYAVT